jgi:hypothetical protein
LRDIRIRGRIFEAAVTYMYKRIGGNMRFVSEVGKNGIGRNILA